MNWTAPPSPSHPPLSALGNNRLGSWPDWGIFLISNIFLFSAGRQLNGDSGCLQCSGVVWCLANLLLLVDSGRVSVSMSLNYKKIWTWDKSASNLVLPVYENVSAVTPRHPCDFRPLCLSAEGQLCRVRDRSLTNQQVITRLLLVAAQLDHLSFPLEINIIADGQ